HQYGQLCVAAGTAGVECPRSGEGYTLDLAHLAAGAVVELELTRFTAREGFSFDPRTAKAFLLSLEADTPHGRGVWSGCID
nr:hypothetical protein [Candidatus Tectomicrobia bacterium]